MRGRVRIGASLAAAAALLVAATAAAQQVPGPEGAARTPRIPAVRVPGVPPDIDGRVDDVAWASAPVVRDFIGFEPAEGAQPSQETEARLLYDDEAIYVAFRAFDTSPDSIVAHLTRRDVDSSSDLFLVLIDSYHDRRTAFQFRVNPVGVKEDLYMYNDTQEDKGWDAVWDAATARDDRGWSAEFRIPLSQLRFSDAARQDWGINFARQIGRHDELVVWAPLSREAQAVVSRSGVLEGLESLSPPSRLEVLPYSAARVTRSAGEAGDPFHDPTAATARVGGDVKIGITNNFTLDLTANPDFGQVEADPGQVNLTAFETSFPERRPFFVEGAGIFSFGLGPSGGSLFYSRRVGRAPQGSVSGDPDWVDRPAETGILGAAKLSGKTAGGWSIGALAALTSAERARVDRGGMVERSLVEPRAGYSVLRVARDFSGGQSGVGVIATLTRREGAAADALDLRRSAYAGGADFRHRFRGGDLEVRGYVLGSRVAGLPAGVLAAQRSSARYFQRPDADHVALDPGAESLAGWAALGELQRVGAGALRWSLAVEARSPGFELNDLGFMNRADLVSPRLYVGWRQNRPGSALRQWNVNLNANSAWTFGGERAQTEADVNGGITTLGNFGAYAGARFRAGVLDPRMLRGGPALRTDRTWIGWVGFETDQRRALGLEWESDGGWRPTDGSWSLGHRGTLRWRPTGSVELAAGLRHEHWIDDLQWIDDVASAGGTHYLLGRLDQTTLGLTLRADVALSPTLTVQYYGEPFLGAGTFSDFKQVTSPRAVAVDGRFAAVTAARAGDERAADLDGDGALERFDDPDFNVRQLRSNAVLRWEYRPGSTLFLVWAQARDHEAPGARFSARDGLSHLFASAPDDVLMIKVSYWLTP
jgi:hypothetical protein